MLHGLRGIVPVLQTPYHADRSIAWGDLERLIDDAVSGGVRGFLVPAVASEVETLSDAERRQMLELVGKATRNKVGFIAGCSSADPKQCRQHARLAEHCGAAAALIAAPSSLTEDADGLVRFLASATAGCSLPLIVQDLDWKGPGLPMPLIDRLAADIPKLAGLKIETVPAGPKYTAVRLRFGPHFHISGGWAVPQMIEALDRGVDAMIPESSMAIVYCMIDELHRTGGRQEALRLFRRLQPILAFSNQDLATSVAFFKRLFVRRGIFSTPTMRLGGFEWDPFNSRVADELIDEYLEVEREILAIRWRRSQEVPP